MKPDPPTEPLLQPGDLVGVVAPGFAVRRRPVLEGIAALRRMGFLVLPGRHLFARDGYLAGSDDERASDLEAMLADPAVRAIWFARGGYGTARLLDRLDWPEAQPEPKVLIGYSDLTALFAAAAGRRGMVCLHGPLVAELGDRASFHAPSLRAALGGREVRLDLSAKRVLRAGRAEAPLAGGNLAVLAHLLGTRFFPPLAGRVLFLEDTGESLYRLDRMLTQLRLADALEGVEGVLLGAFSPAPSGRRFPPDRTLREVLEETFLPLGVPVVTGVPAGHVPGKRTLPLGGTATIDTARRLVTLRPAVP